MRWNRTSGWGLQKAVATAFALACFNVLPGCQSSASQNGEIAEPSPPTVIYLVRHAEKALENPEDPGLSEAGQARADLLVKLLADADIGEVWSTDTRRTRNTAEPVANANELSIQLYDPRGIPAFARTVKQRGGRYLVVGHSNTTPSFVEALGGEPGVGIVEEEYDRLYIVTSGPGGHVETVLIRFGAPYVAMES